MFLFPQHTDLYGLLLWFHSWLLGDSSGFCVSRASGGGEEGRAIHYYRQLPWKLSCRTWKSCSVFFNPCVTNCHVTAVDLLLHRLKVTGVDKRHRISMKNICCALWSAPIHIINVLLHLNLTFLHHSSIIMELTVASIGHPDSFPAGTDQTWISFALASLLYRVPPDCVLELCGWVQIAGWPKTSSKNCFAINWGKQWTIAMLEMPCLGRNAKSWPL